MRFAAKLAFAHRRLWQRDGTYRAAVLLGPPPLLACALAAGLWLGVDWLRRSTAPAGAAPPWAQPLGTPGAGDQPHAAAPAMALPPIGPDGRPRGFTTGWQGEIRAIEVSTTLDLTILPKPEASFTLDQTVLDMTRIAAASPPSGRHVGLHSAALVVRTAGLYAISLRLDRSAWQPADCSVRLALAGQRVVSDLSINLPGKISRSSDPGLFELQPGLYRIGIGFGCWHDQQNAGTGALTVLIRHPGEQEPQPARPDEIVRPVSAPR